MATQAYSTNVALFPTTRAKISVCLDAIRRLDEKQAARPVKEGMALSGPRCAMKCPTCYMECAIIEERLEWWERELGSLGGVHPSMLKKDLAL